MKNELITELYPLLVKAKDFATELTSHNVIDKNLKDEMAISEEHADNNLTVRRILKERGVKPEQLPPAEDIKKIKRKLESEEKKAVKKLKKRK